MLVLVLVCWVLKQQLFDNENAQEIWLEFKQQLLWENLPWLAFALLLMPINWALETQKWRTLMSEVEQLSFLRAFASVMVGVTFSIFTPNRIGEYGGRILLVSNGKGAKAAIATIVGSFAQMAVLLGVGAVGITFFAYRFLQLDVIYMQGIALLSLTLLSLMVICYFNIRYFAAVFFQIKWLRRFIKPLLLLRHYRVQQLAAALLFAILRYAVYSVQYFLVLKFFGAVVPFGAGMAAIATIFLVQTSIPLPPLISIFVRGEVALNVWSYFQLNPASILASTFILWFLNLILPALLGVFIILRTDLSATLNFWDKRKR